MFISNVFENDDDDDDFFEMFKDEYIDGKEEGDIEEIKNVIDRLYDYELNEKRVDGYVELMFGRCYQRIGEYKKAIKYFTQAIKINIDGFLLDDMYYGRGMSLQMIKESEKALNDFNKSIEIKPEESNYYYNRGCCYYDLGLFKEGVETCCKAIELDPDIFMYYYCTANCYDRLGMTEKAIEYYYKGLKLNPTFLNMYYDLCACLIDIKKFEEAIDGYNKALELSPNDSMCFHGKAMCLREMGKYDDALECINEAIKYNPEDGKIHAFKGYLCLQKKMILKGISSYTTAINMSNSTDEVEDNLFNRDIAYIDLKKNIFGIDFDSDLLDHIFNFPE